MAHKCWRNDRASTAQRPRNECATIARRPRNDRATTAQRPRNDCATTAQRLRNDCAAPARRLPYDCRTTAVRLPYDCDDISVTTFPVTTFPLYFVKGLSLRRYCPLPHRTEPSSALRRPTAPYGTGNTGMSGVSLSNQQPPKGSELAHGDPELARGEDSCSDGLSWTFIAHQKMGELMFMACLQFTDRLIQQTRIPVLFPCLGPLL